MDLLFDCVKDVPKSEKLSGLYVVDGHTKYLSTARGDKFKLYTVSAGTLEYFVCEFDNLNSIDTYLSDYIQSVVSQSAITKNDTRIVYYTTSNKDFSHIKHPTFERKEIDRYVTNKQKKLF